MAKQSGYRSRSAYKLKEIIQKFKIFENTRNRYQILDLGAAPGGWLQVVCQEIENEESLIVGVDLKKIAPIISHNVVTIEGDITHPDIQQQVLNIFNNKVNVILSDMAPDVIGEWNLDQYRQIYLARIALLFAHKLLKDNGWFITKIFQGGEHIKFIKETKDMFEIVRNFKPKASRKGSSERYIVARNLKKSRKPPSVYLEYSDEEEDESSIPGDQLFYDSGY
jgi:23S rRNA (uridine2552-2'-O)-methyltransferase